MKVAKPVHEWRDTADEIWATLREVDRILTKTARRQRETDRIIKETARRQEETAQRHEEIAREMKETDRIAKEAARQHEEVARAMKETDRQIKEYNKRFGDFTNRFGEMVEYMVRPNLVSKFEELGFTFTKANRTDIEDKEHNIFTEVDAFLENGDKVMAVEIKNKPDIDDIKDHIERMQKLREYADLHNDKRVYLGAVAGVVFSGSAKLYALKNGFFVIVPSGETFNIIEPKGKYQPQEW